MTASKTDILTQLTPAETCLILTGDFTAFKDMLKYTLADLIIKDVLRSEYVDAKDSRQKLHYITQGSQLHHYQYVQHEAPFIETFKGDPHFLLFFKDHLKIAFKNIGEKHGFVFRLLMKRPAVQDSLKNGTFRQLFRQIRYTRTGEKHRDDIRAAIEHLENTYPQLIKENPTAAKGILRSIGGNILLLKSMDFALLGTLSAGDSVLSGDETSFFQPEHFRRFSVDFNDEFHDFDWNTGTWGEIGLMWDDFTGAVKEMDSGIADGCSGCIVGED